MNTLKVQPSQTRRTVYHPDSHRLSEHSLGRAADHGVVAAQIVVGAMYADGRGVPQDYVRAHMWFNLAAARGNEDTRKHRDSVSEWMTRPQIAEAQRAAREWLDARQ